MTDPTDTPERRTVANEILLYAMQLLAKRDYSVFELREKIEKKFGETPDDVVQELIRKKFLNDRRFAENHIARRKERGPALLREELISRGVATEIIDETLSRVDWPSLRDALTAKMVDWNLRAPLQSRDAARLFRALLRLGYEEDAIHEEIEQLQQQRRT